MEEEELQQEPRYWRWLEQVWGYTGTLAVVAVLGGTLGRGVLKVMNLHEQPANIVCCTGLSNPAAPLPPQPLGVMGRGMTPSVPHVQMLRNAEGRTVEARFVNVAGKLHALPGSRVARQTVQYDDAGRVTRRINLDAAGKPAEDAAGVAVREFDYDDKGRLVRTSYRNALGQPTAAQPIDVAEQRTTYDVKGRPLLVRNVGINGLSKPDAAGEETVKYEYDDAAGVELRRNFVHDSPAENDGGVAVQRIVRNKEGRELLREWQDTGGNAVKHPDVGAARVVREYYPATRMTRSSLQDAGGNPAPCPVGWSEQLVRCNADGMPEWECYVGPDGLPRDNPSKGYAEKVSLYAPTGHKTYEYFWKADGTHADCCEKRYAHSPDGQLYCLSLHADGSSDVVPVADNTAVR